jgi:ferredoxin
VTYVITRLCTNDGACVEVCPVACIHTRPGASQFYIDPDVCIDCEQCEIVCPVDAIFKDVDVPVEHADAIDLNASFFRQNKAVVGPVALETAWQMVHRAHAYARSVGITVTAAVVDEAGAPIAVGRMDGADPLTAELAVDKAYTAAAFHLSTADVAAEARRPWFKSLLVAHRGRLVAEAGGLVIFDGIAIIGAIGVAGGNTTAHDVLCCQAALAVLEAARQP